MTDNEIELVFPDPKDWMFIGYKFKSTTPEGSISWWEVTSISDDKKTIKAKLLGN
jgi:hypothetical protein